jgi:phosphoglycerate dehydrogenase-like enzyme
LPKPSSSPDRLGAGQFVVAGFIRRGFTDLLKRLDDVRVVQTMSAGVEDLVGHIPQGAVLCDAAGVHDASVADWVVMAILAMYRQLPRFVVDQQLGLWRHPEGDGLADLEGVSVLIVGYGSIGRAVETRLTPFGVTIHRVGLHARAGVNGAADLPDLLPRADVVVILLPLTAETNRFVDSKFLASMRKGALLVNPSRGRVVDTDALMQAIEQRRIRAALDVTDPEPLPEGHPLWRLDGVLVTPHMAGSVAGAYDRAWRLIAAQLRRYLSGEPLINVVSEGY